MIVEKYLVSQPYLQLREEFIDFVRELNPKLADQAELKTLEFTNSEIARLLDQPTSTVTSRGEKLKALSSADAAANADSGVKSKRT